MGNIVWTENRQQTCTLRPLYRDIASYGMMEQRGEGGIGADLPEGDGFYTRCLAPVAQDTNREF